MTQSELEAELAAIEGTLPPTHKSPTVATAGSIGNCVGIAWAAEVAQWRKLCEQLGCEGLEIDAVRRELTEHHAFAKSITDRLIEGLVKAGLKDEKPNGEGG